MGIIQAADDLQDPSDRDVAEGRAGSGQAFLAEAVFPLVEDAGSKAREIGSVAEARIADINLGRRVAIAAAEDERGMRERQMVKLSLACADHVIAALRAHEGDLRQAGIRHLSLFGSMARGEAVPESDIDLAVEFDPTAGMDLIRLVALERRIGGTLGRPVEILAEPIENLRLRAAVERDRRAVF